MPAVRDTVEQSRREASGLLRRTPLAGHPAVRRATDLAQTAWNASRLLTGARLTAVSGRQSLSADAEGSLRDARSRQGLPASWTVHRRLSTVADVAVLELCEGGTLEGVLKVARAPAGDAILRSQHETLRQLAGDPRLRDWHRLLPEVLAQGTVDGHTYSVEKAVPGTVGTALPGGADLARTYQNAVRAISVLHRTTGHAAVASSALVDRWVEPALSLVADVPTLLGPARRHDLVERLRERIRAGMEGRTVWLSRTHGDYALGNIFFGPSADVRGIIDWGQAGDDDLALIDPMTLVLVGRAHARGTDLSHVVVDLCRGAPLAAEERAAVETFRAECPADPVDVQVMVLLAWLRHVENNLEKSPRYRTNPVWVHSTLERVLKIAGAAAR